MPTITVKLNPGVNADYTPSLNQATYQVSQLIRWKDHLPQKIGGWVRYFPTAISSIVRALWAWEDLNSILHLAVGAESSLSVITDGVQAAITPQRTITNPAVDFSTVSGETLVTITDAGSNASLFDVVVIDTQVSVGGIILYGAYPVAVSLGADSYEINAASPATSTITDGGAVPAFTTTMGSSSVEVELADHGLTPGDTFPVNVATTVGGITIFGFYTVFSVIDDSHFTINAATVATSSTSGDENGGNARIEYWIAPGPGAAGTGFGIGGFGTGGFGTGVAGSPHTGTPITTTDWTLDNWGSFLVANPKNGPIFVWQPNGGLQTAQIIAQAPLKSTGIFVSMPQQILVAYGAEVLGIQDPLLIRWSTVSDYTVWTADVTNQAGSYRLPRGSRIVGGMQGPLYGIFWTDLGVWAMSYTGATFVFGFNELAEGCGLIAQKAAGVLSTTVYWMNQGGFFILPTGGSVQGLPCELWDVIFQNLDMDNVDKIRCATNSIFDEVTWYFPSKTGGTGENDMYVKYTPGENCWDYGMLGRTAWIDQSVLGPPIGAGTGTNLIYQHEMSNDGDGQALNPYFETGYWALSDGGDIMFVDFIQPDMKFGMFGQPQTATVQVSFKYAEYAQDTVYTDGPYNMNAGNPTFINPRFRGRLVSMRIESSDLGSWWRLGGLRIRSAPDGRQ
jgi:hypothetical protein